MSILLEFNLYKMANLIYVTDQEVPEEIYEDDRFCVIECSDDRVGDSEYFEKLTEKIEDEKSLQQLYSYFMSIDISEFNPKDIPRKSLKMF